VNILTVLTQKKLNKSGWTGTCTCDNASKKKQVCSHQVGLILEWEDQRKLADGTIKKSDKETYKDVSCCKDLLTKKQRTDFNKYKKDLEESSSVDTLKKMLKLNDQVCGGKKVDLIERVAECKVLGIVPRCPLCSGGKPKFQAGYYYCPGYMDDDAFQECTWISRDLERTPWKNEEDT